MDERRKPRSIGIDTENSLKYKEGFRILVTSETGGDKLGVRKECRIMARKEFTDEVLYTLRQNPYTLNATRNRLSLTLEAIEKICVITTWGSKYYLIVVREYGGYEYLDAVKAKDFYVTDNSIPKDWVELKWPFLSPFIKENSRLGVSYRITYYLGPKCILQDNDFLFNLFEDRAMAYSFYQSNIGETNVK